MLSILDLVLVAYTSASMIQGKRTWLTCCCCCYCSRKNNNNNNNNKTTEHVNRSSVSDGQQSTQLTDEWLHQNVVSYTICSQSNI